MHTRMPKFGTANVGHLAPLLESADAQRPLPDLNLPATRDVKSDGWKMVGAQGFSCIKCHTFGRFQATGVQSIDLQIMTRRLREDWFRTYAMNPQAYRPGTRMPSAWPNESARQLPGYRFRGYRLTDDQRPTFLYEVDGFRIEDFPNPVEEGIHVFLSRRLTIRGGDKSKTLYYRAGTGAISKIGDNEFQIGEIRSTITGAPAVIHNNQLLVPITAGTTEILQTYHWP